MRRLIALAILCLALPACGDSHDLAAPSPTPKGRTSTSPEVSVSPSRSSATPTQSPAGGPPPGPARCTLVLGFSVTANWYLDGAFESQPGIDDARWELIWASGYDVARFADPTAPPYSQAPISPCAVEPDRVLYQVAALRWDAPDAVAAALEQTIENIRAAWPSVEVIELIPIVGGPGGTACGDPDRPDKGVVASHMNPPVVEAIAGVADGTDVRAGPDLLLQACAQYRDGPGHLTPDGSAFIASTLADHYGR